ncbi:MAG: HD-GYP domain-containing protein [Nitrospirota bacterium]
MKKRIPVSRLSVGMYMVGVDKSWLETPFLRHKMPITKADQIDALKSCGVHYVEIDTERGVDVDKFAHVGLESIVEAAPDDPVLPAVPVDPTAPTSFDDELQVARKTYQDAKNIVQRAMYDIRMGRDINTDAVGRVVDALADSVLRNSDALISLSRLKSFDEYTFFHSVNTAVLALGLGRSLDMDRQTLHLLGMGTLLHDVGKMKIPLNILNKPDRLRSFEYEIIKQHALRGAEILSKTTGLREEAIKPALEHHERVDGTGYPYQRKRDELSLFGLISSVVDIYDAITSDRVYHKAMPPSQALQFLYQLGQQGHLDPPLVERFIKCVGVYPVGSCVLLNTGEVGIVTQIYQDQPLTPKLLLIRDGNARRVMTPTVLDLLTQGQDSPRTIVKALDPHEFGIKVADYMGDGKPAA